MDHKKIITSSLVAFTLYSVQLFAANDILATVGGQSITKEEVDVVLKPQKITYDKLNPNDKKAIVNQFVDKKILSNYAYKPEIINSKLYKETLEKVKYDLALQIWMTEEMKKITISDGDAKKYYDGNKNKFKQPLQLKASHILVKTEKEASDIIATLGKAKDLKGEFAKMAKLKSADPAGSNGGDLGWFTTDKMVPEFGMAASLLKVGTITQKPVKTQYGYHVIYLDGKKEQQIFAYEAIKNDIKQFLASETFNKKVEAIMKTEKQKTKITIK